MKTGGGGVFEKTHEGQAPGGRLTFLRSLSSASKKKHWANCRRERQTESEGERDDDLITAGKCNLDRKMCEFLGGVTSLLNSCSCA